MKAKTALWMTVLAIVGFGWMLANDDTNAPVVADEDGIARRLDDHGDNAHRSMASSLWNTMFGKKHPATAIPRLAYKAPERILVSPTSSKDEKEEQNESAFKGQDISLPLTEIYNSKKYPNGVAAADFSGHLEMKDGQIEALEVSLPNGESISVAYTSLTGNTFAYKVDGDDNMGAIIPTAEKGVYIVTLTGGPYDQTRMAFGQRQTKVEAPVAVNANPAPAVQTNAVTDQNQNPVEMAPETMDEQATQRFSMAPNENENQKEG